MSLLRLAFWCGGRLMGGRLGRGALLRLLSGSRLLTRGGFAGGALLGLLGLLTRGGFAGGALLRLLGGSRLLTRGGFGGGALLGLLRRGDIRRLAHRDRRMSGRRTGVRRLLGGRRWRWARHRRRLRLRERGGAGRMPRIWRGRRGLRRRATGRLRGSTWRRCRRV
jgi:hypothetical protein